MMLGDRDGYAAVWLVLTAQRNRMLKEIHARTHPARLTAAAGSEPAALAPDNAELTAELAEEEAELADGVG